MPPASTVIPLPSPNADTASAADVGTRKLLTASHLLPARRRDRTGAILEHPPSARKALRPRPGYDAAVVAASTFSTIEELQAALLADSYLADRGLATVLFLALKLEKPVLLEGEAGVGKTEAAKAMARALGTRLIRLQCYEGLDVAHAVYEWNYSRQLLHIRAAQEGTIEEEQLFGPEFLIRRPLLEAIESPDPVVLLIDEVDRADDEFEAFLLELLSDWPITVPEIGAMRGECRGRHPDVEPHTRAPRRAQAPRPLPLDRPSVARPADRSCGCRAPSVPRGSPRRRRPSSRDCVNWTW